MMISSQPEEEEIKRQAKGGFPSNDKYLIRKELLNLKKSLEYVF